MLAIAHEGCTDTVREFTLKVDSERKISCRTGESNLPQRRASPTLYQLSYLPAPAKLGASSNKKRVDFVSSSFFFFFFFPPF